MTQPAYQVRPAQSSEAPFILNSWIGTLRRDVKRRKQDAGRIPPDLFYAAARTRIPALLEQNGALVATLPEVPDEILGWLCRRGSTVEYCFTKEAYRRAGVCRALLTSAGLLPGTLEVACLTEAILGWIHDGRGVIYNPCGS